MRRWRILFLWGIEEIDKIEEIEEIERIERDRDRGDRLLMRFLRANHTCIMVVGISP